MKRRTGKAAALIVFIVLLVTGGAIVFAFTYDGFRVGNVNRPQFMRSGVLESSIVDETGRIRDISARVAIETSRAMDLGINTADFNSIVRAALSEINFEEMSALDGLDHVREVVMNRLTAVPGVNSDAILGIYIVDFVADVDLPPDTIPSRSFDAFRDWWR